MNRFPWQLVVFDLDGTLVDSALDIAEAVDRMRVELGLAPVGEARVRGWIGDGVRVLLQRALADAGTLDLDALMPRFMVHYEACLLLHARVYPGVREALDALAARGVPMALCTNKPERFVPPLLEAMGLAHHLDTFVGGDSLPERKPSPLPLLHLAARFGQPPSACLMVGDSGADAEAAHAAGMPLVLMRYGYPGVVAPRGAIAELDDLRALLSLGSDGRIVVEPGSDDRLPGQGVGA